MRKTWDQYYVEMTEKIAERATCNRLKVGALIVKNHRVISTGYNGSVHAHEHCEDVGCLLNNEGRCIRTIHAEMNAILHAERDELKGATIYTTHEPCENCMKHIAQAGITRVIFLHGYNNPYNQHFTQGMEIIHYEN